MYSHHELLKVINIILEIYPLERQIIGGVSSLVAEAFWIPTLMHSWWVSIDRRMSPGKKGAAETCLRERSGSKRALASSGCPLWTEMKYISMLVSVNGFNISHEGYFTAA